MPNIEISCHSLMEIHLTHLREKPKKYKIFSQWTEKAHTKNLVE